MMTRTTKRFVLVMIAMGIAGIAIGMAAGVGTSGPVGPAGAPCDALVGTWRWFTGGVVSIRPDGTIVHNPGNDGTWECTDPMRGLATLRWRVGGFVNRLALSPDGRALASADPSQSYVTAQRIGAPPVSGPAPAPPADPPRRAVADPPPKTPPASPAAPAKVVSPAPPDVTIPPATPRGPAAGPRGPEDPGQAGPCSGGACMWVRVETIGSCVWLRSSIDDVVQAEVRLAAEVVRMTLAKPDIAKTGQTQDRTSYATMYDPITNTDRPVFRARIERAGGCVASPGEIRSYRATRASAPEQDAAERLIACSGDACGDVDASVEQIAACRLANRGRREIAVGIARPGNSDVSITGVLPPGGTMRLTSFFGCLRADDVGRIEARYR